MEIVSFTIDQAMSEGYRFAYYSDHPDFIMKIQDLCVQDFNADRIEDFGIIMIQNTEIHLKL